MDKKLDLPDHIRQCGEDYLAAFNGRDLAGYGNALHYPFVSIIGPEVTVLYAADGLHPGMFDYMEQTGWDRSVWESARIIQSGPAKAHLAVHFTRRRKDDSVIEAIDCVYAITHENGKWGMKACTMI
jgi:hypothetical protein